MTEQYTCPTCGQGNASDQRFCTNCGAQLLRACPTCSHTNPPGSRFCGNCGTPLTDAPARQEEERRPTEERRLATVLFADISGFTNLTRELADPEEARAVADRVLGRLGEVVEGYGGNVDKVIGDAVMAVFGPPVAHDDDPERAVRAALEMQRRAAAGDEFGGLQLRIGIDTGEVMYAPVGAGSKREFTVIGDAANTAARLQAAAPKGGVLVGEETRLASRAAIEYDEMPPVQVKESERPVSGWLASGVRETREERRAVPLVGREYELTLLANAWEQVEREGRVHLVTLIGPPGIGKTRLATEAAERARAAGARVLRGRSLPYGESSGYGAFAHQVRQLAAIYASDPVEVAREKLEAAVGTLLPAGDAADVAADVAVLIGVAEEAGGDKQALFFAARRFVEALAADQPTVLVFEDIHWAEQSLLDFIEHLAARLRGAPVLLLTLARPELLEMRPTWGGGLPAYTALLLDALSAEESRELAVRLLLEAGEAKVEDMAERLGETGEGNPLFIEELAASLVERATDTAGHLPTTVRGIIAARLDALPAAERSTLLDASVVGKVFWRGALASLGRDGALDRALDALEGRDLVRREPLSRLEGDEEFTFKHMLIREVAYATLPRRVRRERHRAVAEFIEGAAGERASESAAALAHHWREAGDHERAARYLVAAAEQATRAWAKLEAVSLYDQALELIPAGDVGRRREVRLAKALALNQAGDFAGAIPELDALLPELDGATRFEALRARFKATFWGLADAETSRRFAEQERALAEELDDQELLALALADHAAAIAMDGAVEQGVALDEQALAIWPAGRRRSELAEALEWRSLHHYWLGRYDEALEPAHDAYETGVDVHSVAGVVNGSGDLGLALTGLGRHEEALAAFERGVAHGKELELQPRFTARVLNMWAGTLRELYDLAGARSLNEEAIEAGQRVSFPGAIVSGKIDLVMIDLLLGDVGSAEEAWPALADAVEGTRGWHQWLWGSRLAHARAEIDLAAGRNEAAVERAQQSLAAAEAVGRAKYVAASRRTLADALLQSGQTADAVEEARRALAAAERLRHPPTIWLAGATLSRALAAAGDDDGADDAFRRTRETIDAFAAGLSEERRERFLRAPQLAAVLAPAR